MVLGNDFAGTVTALGDNVDAFKIGDQAYGVKPPSAEGTHASHVLVKAAHVLPARAGQDLQALAALPYSWLEPGRHRRLFEGCPSSDQLSWLGKIPVLAGGSIFCGPMAKRK